MTRNTEKRVEIACPIYDENLKKQILQYLDILSHDNIKARVLKSDGHYATIENTNHPCNSQEECIKLAKVCAKQVCVSKENKFMQFLHRIKKR